MRFYIITAIITIIVLVGSIFFRFNLWDEKALPYDDEQNGLNDQLIINFSHVVAENTPKGLAATRFAELVKQKSNGTMLVQIYPNGILYNDDNELQALKEGEVQIIAPTISKMTAKLPSWQVLDLPFLFDNEDQVYEVLHGPLSDILLQELQQQNIHGLTFWHNGFKQIASKDAPLLDVSQFKGQTIRTMPSDVLLEQFKLLHAKPTVTTFNELYAAIQSKAISAQENTLSNLYSKGYYSMHPHITLSNQGILAYSVLMNEAFWNELDEEQQQIIEESIDELQRWQHEEAVKLNAENLQQLKNSAHVQFYTLSEQQRQQWKDTLQPIYNYFEQITNPKYLQQLRDEISNVKSAGT